MESHAPSHTESVVGTIVMEGTTLTLGDLRQEARHRVPWTLWVGNLGRAWLGRSALRGNC